MDANVEVWVCDDASVVTSSVFEIDHAAAVAPDGRAHSFRGLIHVHPHGDPQSRRHRAAAKDVDKQLRRWADGETEPGSG